MAEITTRDGRTYRDGKQLTYRDGRPVDQPPTPAMDRKDMLEALQTIARGMQRPTRPWPSVEAREIARRVLNRIGEAW